MFGMAPFSWADQAHGIDTDGMELAVELVPPKVQEFVQGRKARCNIEVLPDKQLKQTRMVGQMIQDFRGCQAIFLDLTYKTHGALDIDC